MGNYVTSTSFSLMIPGFLKGNTTTSDTEGTNFVARQVELAEGRVNAAISNRYNITEFTTIPPLLIQLTEDIAIYSLLKKTGYRANDRNEYMDDFKEAKDTLDKLLRGDISLTYTDGTLVAPLSTQRFISDTTNYQQIFNLDVETNWDIDSDRKVDIDNTRA